jgi:DNA-binding CsgD family transcriptional regulator
MYLPLVNIIKSIEATINHEEDTKKKLELSRREKEVYLLVIEDHSNVEIAEELFIAESTVKKHIQNIMKKANCNKREELKEFDV